MAKALLLGFVYYIVARYSLGLSLGASNASPVWPPSGIALAALVLGRPSLAAGVFAGAFAANVVAFLGNQAAPWTTILFASLAIACGNTAEGLASAWISRRILHGRPADTPQGAIVFAAAALGASAISAACGTTTLVLFGIVPSGIAPVVGLTWWLGDVTGILVVAPLLLQVDLRVPQLATLRRALPTALLFLVAAFLVFGGWFTAGNADRLMAYTMVLFVAWSAYRHGRPGVTVATFAVAGVLIFATALGSGPFAKATVNDSLVSLDGFLALCALTGLVLAASFHRLDAGDAAERPARSASRIPAGVLLVCIAATMVTWHYVAADTERRAAGLFAQICGDIQDRITERMRTYEEVLLGARGLFDAAGSVDRNQWRRYVESLAIAEKYPGTQAIGFAARVAAGDRRRLVENLRAQGAADFDIHPPGERAEYASITYLEPMDERNARAVGFDLLSEPVRRAGLERARDSGDATITGRITLLQDAGRIPQAGFLMFLPVYRVGMPASTMQERQAALTGYVYSAFRMDDLMQGALEPVDLSRVSLTIYDGTQPSADMLLFRTRAPDLGGYSHQSSLTVPLRIGDHDWTAVVRSTPDFELQVDTQKAQISLVAGTVISLLLFAVVHELVVRRQDALALAARMGAARAEAENRFQSLAESASEGVFLLDERGKVLFCNRAGGRLAGGPSGGIIGRDLHAIVLLPESLAGWRERLASGEVLETFESSTVASGQAQVPVEIGLGTWSASGSRYFSAIVHDVSRRKAAESELRDARANLRDLIDHIPAMISSWDAQLRNRFCNDEHRKWFGLDPATAPGRHYRDLLGYQFYSQNRSLIERVLAGQKQSFERVVACHDGKTRHVLMYYIPNVHEGEVVGFFSLALDISHQKEIEEALEYGLRLHDVIFTHAGVGIACERDERLERVSHRAAELLGYEDRELEDLPVSVIFPDKATFERVQAMAAGLLPVGKTLDHELMLRCKDGSELWCRLLGRAVDSDRLDEGTIWIIDDFSDRKQRESLLETARAAAESAASIKAEFLANMSHEIRTPMNAIIGMTHLTLETDLDRAQRENLLMVQESAEALLRLLNDILDFSKAEAGKMRLCAEDFDLRELLATTLQPFSLGASGKGLELVLDVAPEVPQRFRGDPGRLMQIVTNLVSNAIKFTARGQVVCRVDPACAEDGSARLDFAVVDSGIGIPAAAQARIFEPFVQADSSVTRQYGGTGLGLAICAQIAELMDGNIRVDSEPGAGSTFRFSVRLETLSGPPALSAADLAVLNGRPVPLAIASGEARSAAARMLRAWQMQPVEFATADALVAAAALAVKYRAPYSLVMVDAALWEAAGADLRRKLAELPSVPSIVLLGSAAAESARGHAAVRTPLRHADLLAALVAASGGTPAPGAEARVHSLARTAARPLRILVAEDHPLNQKLAQRVLERRGHSVTIVGDGAKAVAAAHEGGYDVILMDVQMPVMDGVAATRAIRSAEDAAGRHTPIIALTAHALAGERERLLAAGMDDYLSKPYDPAELLQLLECAAAAGAAAAASARNAEGAAHGEAPPVVERG